MANVKWNTAQNRVKWTKCWRSLYRVGFNLWTRFNDGSSLAFVNCEWLGWLSALKIRCFVRRNAVSSSEQTADNESQTWQRTSAIINPRNEWMLSKFRGDVHECVLRWRERGCMPTDGGIIPMVRHMSGELGESKKEGGGVRWETKERTSGKGQIERAPRKKVKANGQHMVHRRTK